MLNMKIIIRGEENVQWHQTGSNAGENFWFMVVFISWISVYRHLGLFFILTGGVVNDHF